MAAVAYKDVAEGGMMLPPPRTFLSEGPAYFRTSHTSDHLVVDPKAQYSDRA